MTDDKRKTFDCVKTMREIRDRISAEITGKTHEELSHWLDAHRYTDPVLQRLARRSNEGDGSTHKAAAGPFKR